MEPYNYFELEELDNIGISDTDSDDEFSRRICAKWC